MFRSRTRSDSPSTRPASPASPVSAKALKKQQRNVKAQWGAHTGRIATYGLCMVDVNKTYSNTQLRQMAKAVNKHDPELKMTAKTLQRHIAENTKTIKLGVQHSYLFTSERSSSRGSDVSDSTEAKGLDRDMAEDAEPPRFV